jgi:hypothetical protein
VLPGSSIEAVHSYGSINLVGDLGPALAGASVALFGTLATALTLAGLAVGYAATWRRLRGADPPGAAAVLVDGTLAAALAYMVLGKVFSPQYLVWVLPLFALRGRARRVVALLGASQVIYPIAYREVMALRPWAMALVLARNLGLGALGVAAARPRARPG